MSKFYLRYLLLFLPYVFLAQEFKTENLTPSKADLETQVYHQDTTANAFYIQEKGFSEFDRNRDYNIVFNYSAQIKILNKNGFDEATIEIPLGKNEDSKEKILKLNAATYNLENGVIKKTPLSKTDIFTKELEHHDLVRFTFPNIKEGSVLVYSYELESPFFFNFTTWKFQDDIPKAYSEFTAQIPGNYEYNIKKTGYLELTVDEIDIVKNCIDFGASTESGDCLKSVYAIKDVPAFKTEDHITSEKNYLSSIQYELMQVTRLDGYVRKYTKNWEDVDQELKADKGIGRQLRRGNIAKGLLPEDISSLPNNIEKAGLIYDFVQKEFTWNHKYHIHRDINLKDILVSRTGNVLEINALLHNIYKNEGFEVLPVLAATRNKGFPTKVHPVLSDFNYFFIQLSIGEEKYLLDATEKNIDFGRLPFRALNGYARLMDFENGSSWIDITPKDYSRVIFNDSIKINKDGTSTGFSQQIIDGYHAYNMRNELENTNTNEIFSKLALKTESTNAVKTEVSGVNDLTEDLKIRYDLQNKSQKIGDKIYFNPFNFKFIDRNPFQLQERNYPIDFGYRDVYSYSSIIEIPEGYKVTELPETKAIAMPGKAGRLIFSVNKKNESVIHVNCMLRFSYASYPPEYYEAIKLFFDSILEVQTQSLIIIEENS
ncbi:DUF3857 domain-containing protein [Christiangramia echinicola]|uniref:DUF3857 domain-containing protein n=1 Tax=Christiangramia echinicola TaxID=279359 RepID=UPI0003FE8982|nr:DUF3857 domain-containing protein [Christiangramia echinicola]